MTNKQIVEESLKSIDSHLSYFADYADCLCNDRPILEESNKVLNNIEYGVDNVADELGSVKESIDELTEVLKEIKECFQNLLPGKQEGR